MKKYIFLILLVSLLLVKTTFAQKTLQEGTWKRIDYTASGSWSIVQKSDGVYIVLDEKFKTNSGPDLHLLFSKKPIEQLKDHNTNNNSEIIAELKSSKGAQEYKIPAKLNWKDYRSIVIHCVRFSHLWAGANL
jgi:hypothetical protein